MFGKKKKEFGRHYSDKFSVHMFLAREFTDLNRAELDEVRNKGSKPEDFEKSLEDWIWAASMAYVLVWLANNPDKNAVESAPYFMGEQKKAKGIEIVEKAQLMYSFLTRKFKVGLTEEDIWLEVGTAVLLGASYGTAVDDINKEFATRVGYSTQVNAKRGYEVLGSMEDQIADMVSSFNNSQPNIPTSAPNSNEADTIARRRNEEKLYAQVAAEMDSEDIKAGLWAKATVDAEGDEGKTKAFYIKYRVQNIQDEQRERLIEIELKNTQLKAEADKKRLESIITAKEMAKHATHRTREGQMLMSQLNIKYDGGKYDGGNYIYSNYKYHLLEHAVNYALKDQKVKDFNINLEEDKIKLETNNQDSYYKTIAGSNDPCTQYDFGIELEKKGKFADAMLLLEAAANQGHISAQYKLGLIYKKGGSGVEKDYTQALKWFRASSEKNYSGGYYQMGLMYLDGLGVAKDINQAIIWFQASLKEGNKLAEEELNKINDSLSKPKKALSSDLDDDILLTDLKNRIAKAKMDIK